MTTKLIQCYPPTLACISLVVTAMLGISLPASAQGVAHNFSAIAAGAKGAGYTFSGTCDDGHKVSIDGKFSAGAVAQRRTAIKIEFVCNTSMPPLGITFTKLAATNAFKFNISTVFNASAPATVVAAPLAEGKWDFEPKQFLSKTIAPNVDVVLPRFQIVL